MIGATIRKYYVRFLNLLSASVPGRKVVFQSDDWGSIRMRSRDIYKLLKKDGFPVHECHYNRNDAIESNADLEMLFNVLLTFKDGYGRHPVFTANVVVCNPDFDRIREHNFQSYFCEPFTKTLRDYPSHDRVYDLYLEGIKQRIFFPQFHGREHVNIFSWMEDLRRKNSVSKRIFEYRMFTVHYLRGNRSCKLEFLDTFGARSATETNSLYESLVDGIRMFQDLFGYRPVSFVAPCFIWDPQLERMLAEVGVREIQAGRVQRIPTASGYRIRRLYTGMRNQFGLLYLTRNVFFEPSQDPRIDWVGSALGEIEAAFSLGRPAVISSHRVNYIGAIRPENRERGLRLLESLLKEILRRWPDVEFLTSVELGKLLWDA